MKIIMPRGDLRNVVFVVENVDGTTSDIEFTEIYMTVKRSFEDRWFIFQKKLSDNTITHDSDGYHFTIEPDDTNDLDFGSYVFDLEFIADDTLKQTVTGTLLVTAEATTVWNEG